MLTPRRNLQGGLDLQCWDQDPGSPWWLFEVTSCCCLGRYHHPRTPWIWCYCGRTCSHLLVRLWILWMWVCPQGMSSIRAQPVSGHTCSSLTSIHDLWNPVLGLNPLWQFHVDVHLDWSLRICYNKVHLSKGPKENDSEDDHKPDGKPCHNWSICLKIIHTIDLLSTVEVLSGLVRLDSVCCEIVFAR